MRSQVSDFCAELARTHKPFRLVPSEELERVAGSVMRIPQEPQIIIRQLLR